MTTRFFGNSGVSSLAAALTTAARVTRGRAVKQVELSGVWAYDVLSESMEYFASCEVLQLGVDSAPLLDRRVLVLVMPDGAGVIIGALPIRDDKVSTSSTATASSSAAPTTHGPKDRTIVYAGSAIVLTEDGDIILRPKRALKIQSPSPVRAEVGGDASDSPVAGKAFLTWASQVDATLAAHEAELILHATRTATPVLVNLAPAVPHVVTPLPANTGDGMVTNGIKMPAGSDQGAP